MEVPQEVTQFLRDWSKGDSDALQRLTPLVYDELRKLAGRHLRRERSDPILQTTALAHEAYIRLIDQKKVSWQNRAHFFAVAAQMIRRILVDHARARSSNKRGGRIPHISLANEPASASKNFVELIALDDALQKLAVLDE